MVPQGGRIVRLAATVGQTVRAGQTLAVIEQTLDATQQTGLSTERANAHAELGAAEQDYARLQSIADIAARKDVLAAELRLRQARQNAAAGDVEIDEEDLEAIDEIGRTVTDRLDNNPVMWNWGG